MVIKENILLLTRPTDSKEKNKTNTQIKNCIYLWINLDSILHKFASIITVMRYGEDRHMERSFGLKHETHERRSKGR